ncbi:MAG: ABC transporter ATP-binding protein [Bacteroidota bacterium]
MSDSVAKPKVGVFRLLEIAGTKRNYLIGASVFALLHAFLALVPFILVYYIIEALLHPPIDRAAVIQFLLWGVAAGVGSYVCLYISGLLSHIAAFNILYELRVLIADRLGKLPLGFVQQFSSGTMKKIVNDEIERIEGFVAHQIPDFVKGFALPVITITYLFIIDWRLAAISFVPLLILAIWIPAIFSSPKTKGMMKKHTASQEEMSSTIVEFVRAMPVMKIFAQTAENFRKYSDAVNGFAILSEKWLKQSATPFAVFMSFTTNATLPILALGTYLYLQSGLEVATLILFLILGVGYIKPVFALSNMGMQIMLINQGVKRMDGILQTPIQEDDTQTSPQRFSIAFENVDFSYEKEIPVLKQVSFILAEGSINAFIGPSGAGKSTTAQLIARFWDVSGGRITIGGVDIRQFPLADLMEMTAFVFQDSFMFHDTILENIRMGMDKTEAEVVLAARAAQCHAFIERLPEGYQSKYGAQGVYLSGGEQQRIQLARAILKDAPILILDEATAFSDPENEFQIQQTVSHLIQGKTVVIIAHRLSTVVDADQIILFDQGEVANVGTHDSLLEESGLYQKMWNAHTRAQEFAL